MAFSTSVDITSEFKKIDFSAGDSSVTTAEVDEFILQSDAEINTYLANRYLLPITGSDSLSFLKKISIDLVTFRVVKIISVRKPLEGSNGVLQKILEGVAYNNALKQLKMLSKGEITLPDAPLISDGGVSSFNQKNNIEPTIHKGVRQW